MASQHNADLKPLLNILYSSGPTFVFGAHTGRYSAEKLSLYGMVNRFDNGPGVIGNLIDHNLLLCVS